LPYFNILQLDILIEKCFIKNMKKLIAFFLLILFIFTFFSPFVLAQTSEEGVASPSAYQLPYPGMLPDHPLYKLKVLRDKIILFFIRDPFKKAAKHLHMADKELLMALKLAEKGNIPLTQHTAFKAEHHMTLMVNESKRAVYSGRELDTELVQRAHQAAIKHQELLAGMLERANEKEQEAFKTIKEFSTRNDNELFKLEQEIEDQTSESDTSAKKLYQEER